MATFIVLRQPVFILVTVFTNPANLTNDLFILIIMKFYIFFDTIYRCVYIFSPS